jgi:hypothetical protein
MPSPQESLDQTLQDATAQITAFLTTEQPAIAPVREALARVAPFLPCANPTSQQKDALQQYRKNLEALQQGLPQLTERLLVKRAALMAKQRRLNAARAYQQSATF